MGERRWNAKLKDDQINEIRKAYDGQWGCYSKLAAAYGVDPESIRLIVKRKTWTHL